MEFLVDMVTAVSDGITDVEVDAIRTREAARSRELAAQRHLLRLWRPALEPGEWRTWGLFRAAGATELETLLLDLLALVGIAAEPGLSDVFARYVADDVCITRG